MESEQQKFVKKQKCNFIYTVTFVIYICIEGSACTKDMVNFLLFSISAK